MAPVGETSGADAPPVDDVAAAAGAAGAGKKGSYVPPALRGDRGAGERMGGSKFGERDDFATLRVTNVRLSLFQFYIQTCAILLT